MTPRIVQDKPGRPLTGSEAKSKTIKFRIEPSLLEELTYACRRVGVPISAGIREGIIMFIKECSKRYY